MDAFCDNKTASLILSYVENKASREDIFKIKLVLLKYLEESATDHGFDEGFILQLMNALFTGTPKKSLQDLFEERSYDGFGKINKKLHVLFCTKIDPFFGYCNNLDLPFYKTYTDAVRATGLDPKVFARKNNVSFDAIFGVYNEWYLSTGSTGEDHYQRQIADAKDFIRLCDLFGINPTRFKDPLDWWTDRRRVRDGEAAVDRYDFKQAVLNCSKEECRYFARWFSKKPSSWFVEDERWIKRFE